MVNQRTKHLLDRFKIARAHKRGWLGGVGDAASKYRYFSRFLRECDDGDEVERARIARNLLQIETVQGILAHLSNSDIVIIFRHLRRENDGFK